METVKLKSWEEFEEKVSKLLNLRDPSAVLFRGQAQALWGLDTTLDRTVKRDFGVEEYYDTLQSVRPAVISNTGKSWELRSPYDEHCIPPQGYEFMVYLRHHGFPSPLLDWTRSPYVAAYFAFRSYQLENEGEAAIFAFVEYANNGGFRPSDEARITRLGPYVVSHKRHYAQQCEYTVCTKKPDQHLVYAGHNILKSEDAGQKLVKYILPNTERGKILKRLELMNITAYSLFGNEESLMETLAYQEILKHPLRHMLS